MKDQREMRQIRTRGARAGRACSTQGRCRGAPSRDHVFCLPLITFCACSLQNHQPSPSPSPCFSLSSRTCKKALGMLGASSQPSGFSETGILRNLGFLVSRNQNPS